MSDLISREYAIKRFGEDGTWLERQGVTTLSLVEAKQRAVDLLESFPSKDITETEACQKCQETTERILLKSSADRPTGEWVRLEREENVYDLHGVPTWGVNYMCERCGFITTAIQDHFAQYRWCPSCGAKMEGGEEE